MEISLCYTGTKNHYYEDTEWMIGDFPYCGYATKAEYEAFKRNGSLKLKKKENTIQSKEFVRNKLLDAITRYQKPFYMFQGRIGFGEFALFVDVNSDITSVRTSEHKGMYIYMQVSENALKGLHMSFDYSGDHFIWAKCLKNDEQDLKHSGCVCKVAVPYEFIHTQMLAMSSNRHVGFEQMMKIIRDSIVTLTRISDKAVVYNGSLETAILG